MRALVVEIAGIPMAVVAIAIAVSKVAVAAAYVFGAVKHKCHILEYPLLVEFFNVFQTTSVHEADAYDKQIGISVVLNNTCVCHYVNRWTVKYDVIVLIAQLVEHIVHLRAQKQFCGVGRQYANG